MVIPHFVNRAGHKKPFFDEWMPTCKPILKDGAKYGQQYVLPRDHQCYPTFLVQYSVRRERAASADGGEGSSGVGNPAPVRAAAPSPPLPFSLLDSPSRSRSQSPYPLTRARTWRKRLATFCRLECQFRLSFKHSPTCALEARVAEQKRAPTQATNPSFLSSFLMAHPHISGSRPFATAFASL